MDSSLERIVSRGLLVLCILMSGSGLLADVEERKPPAGAAKVGISEVCFLPVSPDKPRWIEIYNYGDRPVDIRGWCLAAGDEHVLVLPHGMGQMPPKTCLLIRFDGPSCRAADQMSFGNKQSATLHCREAWAPKAFSGWANECALYASKECKGKNMVDYIRWGRAHKKPSDHSARAASSNLWTRASAGGVFVGHDPAPGDPPGMVAGGSLCRVRFRKGKCAGEDWFCCPPSDVTPGRPNELPAPTIHNFPKVFRLDKTCAEEGTWFTWLWAPNWAGYGRHARSHLQVATDPGFTNVVLDAEKSRGPFHLSLGTYYWRVRYYYRRPTDSVDQTTKWSDVTEFSIVKDSEE